MIASAHVSGDAAHVGNVRKLVSVDNIAVRSCLHKLNAINVEAGVRIGELHLVEMPLGVTEQRIGQLPFPQRWVECVTGRVGAGDALQLLMFTTQKKFYVASIEIESKVVAIESLKKTKINY